MTKTYCDICGKPIDFPKFKFELRTNNGCCISSITSTLDKIDYDLCKDCHEKITNYVSKERRKLNENQ